MKVTIKFPLLKLALAALLLPILGCGTSTDTSTSTGSAAATPPVSPPSAEKQPAALTAKPQAPKSAAQVRYLYTKWKQSWADMKIDTFMSFYSPRARSGKTGYSGIRERKIRQWQKESFIGIIDIGAPTIKVKGNSATLTALQVYDSTTWWDKGQKSLTWQKSGGRWLIVQESFKVQSQRSKTAPVVAAAPPPINQVVESQPVPDDAVNTDGSSVFAGNGDSSVSDTDTDSDFSSPSISSDFGQDASSSSKPLAQSGGCSSGATAICSDGTTSYSAHRRGTCSHHGGVATWCN